ncbi:16S rRNA (guanine(527)-N(7))-methyltransferase RsmG [Caulobacter sp. NIBR1757]|uniref:16S rRNA (guanine(527)-N(7))-methyltransferase RsmG n=1 Tax=Caulobacter sp. NIBR1757 TaxID=3016000 RepID=UPI0022F0B92F|nr:16S rRNA (guanine(527)-N(7))-methyltransferase RsmG [Caulobacter sp. NIBR1757]WGM37168.1 Ribosomal RNA small subunit methyltransferase G [Caulobacter sp. NIBR1757]
MLLEPLKTESPQGLADAIGATSDHIADLERYRAMLEDWNSRMNLVGPSAMAVFWSRHALDSAQLIRLAPDALRWADLGTGAGLPGLVLAILLKGREGAQVHLVESLAKRCRFLSEVVSELGLPATVHNARAEDVRIEVDVVTARAVAALPKLLGFAEPCLKRGARGLFLKGQAAETELAEARGAGWKLDAALIQSLSDPDGRIVDIRSAKRGR